MGLQRSWKWFVYSSIRRWGVTSAIAPLLLALLAIASPGRAQTEQSPPTLLPEATPQPQQESFPPNPLEEPIEDDPLLPQRVVDRPLSPQERSILTASLEELNQLATAKFQAGDVPGAFAIWNRELRLRRLLGITEETRALSRVGEVAWRENQTTEVRVITQRLQQIQNEVQSQTPVDYNLLLTIAGAYRSMRAVNPAIGLYNQILDQARQEQNRRLEQNTLEALGDMYLLWFDFNNAATTYLELVQLADARGDRVNQIAYLRQLAYAYQQGRQFEQAIAARQQLIRLYEGQQDFLQIPLLKLEIGDAYMMLERPELAAPSYQEAFAVARSGQQYGFAGDALQRLAELYRSLNRLDDALVVYQLLVDVHQQTYDNLGIMNTYDQMGQIYRTQGNTPQAIALFQRGLQLAQQLSYGGRVTYFQTQIQTAGQPQP